MNAMNHATQTLRLDDAMWAVRTFLDYIFDLTKEKFFKECSELINLNISNNISDFQDIKECIQKKFNYEEFDLLRDFVGYLSVDPARDFDWRTIYLEKIMKRKNITEEDVSDGMFLDKNLITVEEAFQLMIAWLTWYHVDFGIELPKFVVSFKDMMSHPLEHKAEWDLWNSAVEKMKD